MWKYGMTTRYRSLPLITYEGLVHDSVWTTLAQMFPCVSIAPFGVPVVPPVYCRTARSSGRISSLTGVRVESDSSRTGVGLVTSCDKASVPSTWGGAAAAAEYSASDVTMTCSIDV